MNVLKSRLHRLTYQLSGLIEQLADEDLETAWRVLQQVYCDLYTIKAINEAKRQVQPGDTMNYEEAVRVLRLP
ncbi:MULTISPECIES: hypothetical protein [Aerosakkonema]|uniref:Uncharacterized protein n=1 Tax=Aerosakkonema funiforme FACHB-1375 TaxID=2949571 RepID=A0A926ZFI3_9CYAN|nr:hypothetical protein [Aerosakkonema funiforme]MBD2180890.1 hypothetical protein [Aerosakkonema funiforme FACHB-1375]